MWDFDKTDSANRQCMVGQLEREKMWDFDKTDRQGMAGRLKNKPSGL